MNERKRNRRTFAAGWLAATLVLACAGFVAAQTGNISGTEKYVWSENAGWINFRPLYGGVMVYTYHLEGYAWAENVGWIRMGSYTGGGNHSYVNTDDTNWGVGYDTASDCLYGYAWSANAGWIYFPHAFSSPAYHVALAAIPGQLSGWAWSENLGWIHFRNAAPAYGATVAQEALLVELSDFRARGLPFGVRLEWATRSETGVAGFHLWRTPTPGGAQGRITSSPIPAEGLPGAGAVYQYDDLDAPWGEACLYWLEEVDNEGRSSFHGPVRAVVGGPGPFRDDSTVVPPDRAAAEE